MTGDYADLAARLREDNLRGGVEVWWHDLLDEAADAILALLADLDAARARHPMTPDPLDLEAALPLNSWCGYDIECAWGLGCDAHRLRAEVERLRGVITAMEGDIDVALVERAEAVEAES